MRDEQYRQAAEIFQEAAYLEGDARTAYLDQSCKNDPELRDYVERLLIKDDSEEDALEESHLRMGYDLLADAFGLTANGFDSKGDAPFIDTQMPETIGRYRIIKKIGEGGMGSVFLAEQETPQRRVALKMIRPGMLSPGLRKRFQLEAEVLGKLQHPGIAQIFDAGEIESLGQRLPYFAMEFVEGVEILKYTKTRESSVRDKLELTARIADAVHHAHQKGIVHRDLKPDNILVMRKPDTTSAGPASEFAELGQPKVLDFGVARATDGDVKMTTLQTDIGQLVGTITYMSPEQVKGDSTQLDVRSDIYALGVMLYEMLAGRPPFDLRRKPIPEAARIIREDEPTRLGSVDTAFRGDIDTIVCKAMEKDRDRRYLSAAQLAADIRRYLAHEPIIAHPPSTFYELKKFARRHKGLVAGLLLSFLILTAGIISSLTFGIRATHNEERALTSEDAALRSAYQATLLAAQVLGDASPVRALKQLDIVNPAYRGWEWHHMRACLDAHVAEFKSGSSSDGHWSLLGLDPHGSIVAALARNETIERLHAATGARETVLPDSKGMKLKAMSADLNRLALYHEAEQKVRVWDIPSQRWLMETPIDSPEEITTCELKADGSLLALGGHTRFGRVIDVATGRDTFHTGDLKTSVWHMIFHPTKDRFIVNESAIKMYSSSGELLANVHRHEQSYILAFSPDGKRLAIGYALGKITLHDGDTLESLHVLGGHTKEISALAFSLDGKSLASSSKDGSVRIWDLATLETRRIFGGQSSSQRRTSLSFSGDGTLLAAGASCGIRLWTCQQNSACRTLDGKDRFVYHVVFSPDSSLLASASFYGNVRLWDALGGTLLACHEIRGSKQAIGFTPEGDRLLSPDRSNTPGPERYLVMDTAACVRLKAARTPSDETLFAILGDEIPDRLEKGFQNSMAGVLSGGVKRTVAAGENWASSWDASLLADLKEGRSIRVMDTSTGELVKRTSKHAADLFAVAFDPDGTRLVTGDADGGVTIWDYATGKALATRRGHEGKVYSVNFSPDSSRIVSGGEDGTVILWDGKTLERTMVFHEHESYVHSVTFSPDGTMLASGSGDGTMRVWDSILPAERWKQVRQAEALRQEAAPWVRRLVEKLGDPLKAADRIRTDPDLSDIERRAALDALRY